MNPAVLASVITGLVGTITAYLLAVRKMSGKIGTSDADRLWKEAGILRTEANEQNAQLRLEIADLRRDFEICRSKLADLEARTNRLGNP